jgi:hypothetical protein
VHGIPAGPVETVGLLLVLWIAAHRVRLTGAWVAAGVAVAASVATATLPGDRGLNARYYATAAAGGAHERSTENHDRGFTRVDRRLAFARGTHDFPLAFFNDHTRFNFMRMGDPDRRYLEFAVAWTGWWHAAGGPHTVFLHAPKASAQLSIDTTPVLTSDPASSDQSTTITLAEGWHRLHITFSSPYGAPREFAIGEVRDGRQVPFGAGAVRTDRIDRPRVIVARVLDVTKLAADLLAFAWLVGVSFLLLLRRIGEVWQRHGPVHDSVIALFVAAGAVESLRFAWPWADRLRIMAAGDDTMVYEGYARDILLNGILMNGGAPPGQGEPFYYQAFYPYFLAATHAVFGEGFFGAIFLQRFLVVVSAVMLTRIAMRLAGDSVRPFALIVSALFGWWKIAPISADMLNESLYVPLLCAWTLSLLETCRAPSPGSAARAGLLGGLAAITRSTAMLAWVPVWPVFFKAIDGTRRRTAVMTIMIACSLAVFSLIAIRNWIVSHTFAPTSTEFGITLLGGNPPPAGLVIDSTPRKAVYERLGIGGHTQEVIEYAIAAPGAFTANMLRKAAFALGFYEPYAPGWGYSPVYISTWIAAAAGIVLLWRRGGERWAMLLPLLIAATQYAALVVVYPKGERLILPIHTMLVPYASVAVEEMWTRARRSR